MPPACGFAGTHGIARFDRECVKRGSVADLDCEIMNSSRRRGGLLMKRFIEGDDRSQSTLLPDCLEDYVNEDDRYESSIVFVDRF